VAQSLYSIGLGARTARAVIEADPRRAIEPLEYVLAQAEAGLADCRALIFDLLPEALEAEGMVTALVRQVEMVRSRYGLNVETRLIDEPDVPSPVKETLYRIGREALHNAAKHAQAETISVTIDEIEGHLRLEVRDDGRGFDPNGDFPGHLGLKSMRQRAAGVDGSIEMESVPGRGTRITVRVPVPQLVG
jgi:signal transduction histidine kinase